ncbi:MAG: VOC family protein [Bacteriovorax sp.]|nr:VOC family protein [Bacteriovorax sp.]
MSSIQPYLMFSGNCEEAIKFYCDVFGGDVQYSTKYKDGPMDVPENWKEKIMHTTFIIRGDQLMASDSFPGNDPVKGNNINLFVSFDKNSSPDEIFSKLAVGGKITLALENTFWGARFGQLVDRYGVSWMFNQELEQPKKSH